MTINYLPGKPTASEGTVSFVSWHNYGILAYCSGNNLIILTKNFESMQTIYLPSDAKCCDINKHNGKIAVAVGLSVMVYKPVIDNFYDYTYYSNRKNPNVLNIQWEMELELENGDDDKTLVSTVNWSDNCSSFLEEEGYNDDVGSEIFTSRKGSASPIGDANDLKDEFNTETSSELVIGSQKSLTLWRLFYKNKRSHSDKKLTLVRLWFQIQSSPVYMAKLSHDTSFIASCGRYDKHVKIWRRLTFGIEHAEFDLSYLKHSHYVTSFRWRSKSHSHASSQSRSPSYSGSILTSISRLSSSSLMSLSSAMASRGVNILYTFAADSTIKIFSTFEADSKHVTQFNGSLNLKTQCSHLQAPYFLSIMDSDVLELGINSILEDIGKDSAVLEPPKPSSGSLQVPKLGKNRSNSTNSYIQEREIRLNQLLTKSLDLCMVIDAKGRVEFFVLENLSQYPPKLTKASRLYTKNPIVLSPNCFPKNPRFLSLCDLLVTRTYDQTQDSLESTLSLAINDLEKGSLRHVEFLFDDVVNCLLDSSEDNGPELIQLEDDGDLFDESQRFDSLKQKPVVMIGSLQHKYSGHDKSIRSVRRSIDGCAFLSLTRFGESHVWVPTSLGHGDHEHKHHSYRQGHSKHLHYYNGNGVTLSRKSLIHTESAVIDAVVFNRGGDYVLTLLEDGLNLWMCKNENKLALSVAHVPVDTDRKPLVFFLLPERDEQTVYHLVAVYSKTELSAWEVSIDPVGNQFSISAFKIDEFPAEQEDIHLISAIDPVGWEHKINDPTDSYKYDIQSRIRRDVVSLIDKEGNLRIYTSILDKDNDCIQWVLKSHDKTLIKDCSHIKASSINKCAIASSNSKKLSIWDTKTSFLEYVEDLDEPICDLDWTCTYLNNVSILSVGFRSKVLLYSQLRYDYTNEMPSYAPIRSIDISPMTTHDIGDSTWLKDGTLVIGSGNQFYVADKSLDVNQDTLLQRLLLSRTLIHNDIFTMGLVVNGPLPFFHPQFLIQSLFLEKFEEVKMILVQLYSTMRQIDLDPNGDIWTDMLPSLRLNIAKFVEKFIGSGSFKESGSQGRFESGYLSSKYQGLFEIEGKDDESELKFDKNLVTSLIEKLQKVKLPFLTGHQQITLVSVIEIVQDIDTNYKNVLDDNGLRYYLGLKLYQLNVSSKIGFSSTISMRDVSFALHSENKDLLFNIINDILHSELIWTTAKNYGLAYWLSNERLIEQFEKIARNEHSRYADEHGGEKNPGAYSIFYLALKKKQILVGLWRMSNGNPEQQKMLKFLKNDFKEKRWRTAALKNAFALLSKHRYMDALNFFLLGDSLKDCVNVIIKQLDDLQLAIAVARCYEGSDSGPVLKDILVRNVLPCAVETNNRWLKSYLYHMLGERENSISSLIDDEFIDDKQLFPTTSLTIEEPRKKSFLEYDPVLIVLYRSLRQKGASSSNEYRFITKIINIYKRMGCEVLSLYIVTNWKFNYRQIDDVIKSIAPESVIEKEKEPVTNGNGNANFLTEKLTLGDGGVTSNKKKFIAPPTSLEFDMDAFNF